MRQGEFVARVVGALRSAGVRYFITGSTASTFYGEPRMTADVDIVVDLRHDQVASLLAQFAQDEYCVSEEAAHAAIDRGGMFNIIHGGSGNKADLVVPRRDAFVVSQMTRAREATIPDAGAMRIASPEDVILSKMRFYREGQSEKHLRDIAGILGAKDVQLDLAYIEHWVELLGLADLWREVLNKTQP